MMPKRSGRPTLASKPIEYNGVLEAWRTRVQVAIRSDGVVVLTVWQDKKRRVFYTFEP